MPLVDLDARREYCRKYAKKWCHDNLDKRRAYETKARRLHPEKQAIKARRQALRRKYGIEIADYEAMLLTQNGLCAICRQPPRGKKQRLCVDHNHQTGQVRGLLCDWCNHALGVLESPMRILFERYLGMPMMPGQTQPGGSAFGTPGQQ